MLEGTEILLNTLHIDTVRFATSQSPKVFELLPKEEDTYHDETFSSICKLTIKLSISK